MNQKRYMLGFNHGYAIIQEKSNKKTLDFINNTMLSDEYYLGLIDGKKTALEEQPKKLIKKTLHKKQK